MKYLSSVIAFILLISICYLAKCSADVGPIVENALRNEDWTKFAELVEVAEMVKLNINIYFLRKDFLLGFKL